MQQETSPSSNSKAFGRSAVSNGTRLLAGADGRSKAARRFRDLVNSYCEAIGTEISRMPESQRTIVRQAAGVSLQCETMQTAIVNGHDVDVEQMVRLSNLLARLLRALGIDGGISSEEQPDLASYLLQRTEAVR